MGTYARSVSATPPPPPSSEPETTPEEYRQRALLFADLGRYDDAADEIAAGLEAAPTDAALLATLARVHLAADQPAEALVAADRAVAAAPNTINPLVVRAMALADSSRYADAAQVATEMLRRWPDDPYAQRTGAALLSEARNGQEALNAAWNGVRVAPSEAEAHLVLALVAARLRLFDLAQRAYGEALDLDADVGDAQHDVGIVRLERRRWARALEGIADDAALDPPAGPAAGRPDASPSPGPAAGRPDASPSAGPAAGHAGSSPPVPSDGGARETPYPSPFPRRYETPDAADTSALGDTPDLDPFPDPSPGKSSRGPAGGRGWFEPPTVSRPSKPVLDPSEDSADAIRQAVLYGATGTLVAAALTALMTTASGGASRVWAGMIGAILLVAVPIWLSRRLTEPMSNALSRLRSKDRRLAFAVYATFAAQFLIVLYAVIGGLPTLIAAVAVLAAADALVLARRR
jgi:tetratricopeptide (TPR) repeat protein